MPFLNLKSKYFLVLICGFSLSLAVSVILSSWTDPTQTPPLGNVSEPINVGTSTQSKAGHLVVGGNNGSVADPDLWVYGSVLFGVGSAPMFYFDRITGNVGIGTTTPLYRLDVNGDINLPSNNVIRIAGSAGSAGQVLTRTSTGMAWQTASGSGSNYWNLSDSKLYASSTNWNVGIGTSTPRAKLTVSQTSTLPILELWGVGSGGGSGTNQFYQNTDTDFTTGGQFFQTAIDGTGPNGGVVLAQSGTGSGFIDERVWYQFSDPSNSGDWPYDIAIDSNYAYIVGGEVGTSDQYMRRWRIEKRRLSDGGLEYAISSDISPIYNYAMSIAIDGTYMYVVGAQELDTQPVVGRWRIEKRRLDTGGLEYAVFGNNPNDYMATSIVIDSSYMYIAGSSIVSGDTRWYIEKRNLSDGSFVVSQEENISSGYDEIFDIAVDANYLYLVGVYRGNYTHWHIEKRKKSDLILVYQKQQDLGSYARGITIDSQYMYVVGSDSGQGQWRLEQRLLSTGEIGYAIAYRPLVGSGGAGAYDITSDSNFLYIVGSTGGDWYVEKRRKIDGSLVNYQTASYGTSQVVRAIKLDGAFTNMYLVGSYHNGTSYAWVIEKRGVGTANPPLYYSSGTYTSRIFDAGQNSDFKNIYWNSTLPAGTSISFQLATSSDNINWSPYFGSFTTSGQPINTNGRYLRYQATLSTSNQSYTPKLDDLTITYSPFGSSIPDLALVTVTSDGKVGIGTSTPVSKIDVVGSIAQRGSIIHADIAEDYEVIDEASYGDIVSIDNDDSSAVTVRRANKAYDNFMIGVISENPGYRIYAGKENWKPVALVGRVAVKISLENGPIKKGDPVTSSSIPGVGMRGDKNSGKIVGYALEPYNEKIRNDKLKNGIKEPHTILIFVNVR